MSLLSYVSFVATVNNVLFFSTGILTCRKIIRSNSTDNVSHLPFLITAFSSFMWVMYGLSKKDSTIVLVNTIGMILQCTYLICHFIYSKSEPVFRHTVYIMLLTCSLLSYFKFYLPNEEESVNLMGLTCVVITVIMFGSPLLSFAKILRTRSSESLSFPLSMMTVLNSGLWLLYGHLINDVYIVVPNVLGLILGLLQIVLFCLFPSSGRPVVVSL
ncbi:sugar transporter SWEET1-like [Xenia sp. Carnegie-2017]|uniref:sugar transporter SWEET1-like n=1 Tax=Xenia sp. Carnegie-2017 TaxID=2897299 RepID=UPI001F048250|nr:sugar transporter SWEET1-like [Xenia sp. Carnegie-2017]